MEPGRNRKYQQIIISTEIETVIEKLPTDKSPGTTASQANSIKHLRRVNTYPSEMPSVNCRGRSNSFFFFFHLFLLFGG